MCLFFLKILFFLFLEKGEGREKERETSIDCHLHVPRTRDQAWVMCPDQELNW